MKLILIILTVAIASSCGSKLPFAQEKDLANIQSRIINGYAAEEGQVPYIVGLMFFNGTSYFRCGGSIIGNTWILTAAHCVDDMISVTIKYGSTKWDNPLAPVTEEVDSVNFIKHPQYNSNFHADDIALIHTPHVPFSKLINKIKLADRDNSYEGSLSMACGWGRNQYGTRPTDLQCVNLTVLSNVECNQLYYNMEHISNTQLCISHFEGKVTCQGDSGGPLVSTGDAKLIGVTSFGGSPCQSKPIVFSRVSAYLDWIRHNTGIQ